MNRRSEQISSGQMFCLLVCVRLCSAVLAETVSYVQFFSELLLSAILSLTAWLIVRFTKAFRQGFWYYLLAAGAVAIGVLDAVSFCRFNENVVRSAVPLFAVITALALCTFCAAWTGTQAPARFSAIALMVVLTFLLIGVQTNLAAIRGDFFAAKQTNDLQPLSLIKCFDVPLVYILLAPHTNGKKGAALFGGQTLAFSLSLGLQMMCRAVMGKTASVYKSPMFALFQLGKAGTFTKLDILFLCAVLVLLFTKLSLSVSLLLCRRKGEYHA